MVAGTQSGTVVGILVTPPSTMAFPHPRKKITITPPDRPQYGQISDERSEISKLCEQHCRIGPIVQPCGSPCSSFASSGQSADRSSNLDHGAGGRGLCVCRLFMKRRSLRVKNRALRAGPATLCCLPNRTHNATTAAALADWLTLSLF